MVGKSKIKIRINNNPAIALENIAVVDESAELQGLI